MIKIGKENDCVGCETCVNCGRRESYLVCEDLICDQCGTSTDVLYDVGGEQLCADCILGQYEQIDEDNFTDFVDD